MHGAGRGHEVRIVMVHRPKRTVFESVLPGHRNVSTITHCPKPGCPHLEWLKHLCTQELFIGPASRDFAHCTGYYEVTIVILMNGARRKFWRTCKGIFSTSPAALLDIDLRVP